MKPVIDESNACYIVVTLDRDETPKPKLPPRILSRNELPTDEQLFAVHRELFGRVER